MASTSSWLISRRFPTERGDAILQHPGQAAQAGEHLAEIVMQVLPDAVLFAFADLEDLGFEIPEFGDIGDDSCIPRG